jgi:phospholipase C
MKFAAKILLFTSLAATFAIAQCTQPGQFCHIIIVVQENRTPDDIFGANLSFESGVDLAGGGYGIFIQNGHVYYQFIQNTPRDLNGCVPGVPGDCKNPDHSRVGWVTDYHSGSMDGFCHEYAASGQCPSYSYVPQTDVQPYFDIATNYGFANYFFQTNEGPSFEAHQFLFSGTSTGVSPGQTYSQYFVSELPSTDINGNVGCPYTGTSFPPWVYTDESNAGALLQSECYPHDTLVTNSSGDKGVTWGYYTPSVPAIWNAPEALSEVCVVQPDGSCGGPEWTHVHVADEGGYSDAPIFYDLKRCTLPAISWVIPDKRYSDHAEEDNTGLGPSFVGDIVDAVGGGMSGSTCNPPSTNNALYWKQQPTAIFILWDDWGGWFDHVQPWAVYKEDSAHKTTCPSTVAPNGWGCGYTSGFRVPLLVVSPYTQAGTISGKCGVTGYPNCPNFGNNKVYVHDFGSILAFTEHNFGLKAIDQSGDLGYADYNAPDWGPQRNNIPLSDFFGSTFYNFTSINTSEPYTCFQNFGTCTNTPYVPGGPDSDDGD